uniref:large ribosomal subunit protein mL45 n=1 Tax=Lonchura striata TaxID=40157 RepID=UPI000B4C2DE3|nr:39S ribosomal protein L45, mitochondrial [Lonchura striata domestica]
MEIPVMGIPVMGIPVMGIPVMGIPVSLGNGDPGKWGSRGCGSAVWALRGNEGEAELTPRSAVVSPQGAESLLRAKALPCVAVPVRGRRKWPRVPEWARELSAEEKERRLRSAAPVFPDERMERTFFLACTAEIMDPYVPPEGDARLTSLSKDGVKQQMQKLRQTAASQLAYVPLQEFFWEPLSLCWGDRGCFLCSFNKQKLHSLVTERCYPDMVRGNRYRTIRWRFVESLEPPRVVHVRCEGVLNRGNLYGQVTVRMHSRQILAIYDRFGRLMYGGEEIPKDVLEYVVFERYLVNPYGTWRMHGKIIPEWAPPKDPIIKTVMIPAPDASQEHETVK